MFAVISTVISNILGLYLLQHKVPQPDTTTVEVYSLRLSVILIMITSLFSIADPEKALPFHHIALSLYFLVIIKFFQYSYKS